KNRIREIAGELIKIAAERHLHEAPKLPVQPHVYDEFCARFPYEETEDQLAAINATLKDLEIGRPMDRLICGDVGFGKTEVALRTFVAPHDPVMIREALLRERYRGGQAFYVVPRIEDLPAVKDFLDKNLPEMKVAVAHGQMAPTMIEDIMSAFYDGKYDILLSTTIIESGLDIPTANTLIVHRADMFGLAQLYQLRGRVGRSKL